MLEECPGVVFQRDSEKRLPLHHAIASSTASFETVTDIFNAHPKAASLRDPVTRLYPFMLASHMTDVSGSLSLLLANPNLVIGGDEVHVP